MRRLLDIGLEQLTTILFKMGKIAEDSIDLSIRGFLEGMDVSDKVNSLSEILITMSMDAEDKAFELIAKYQPVASDLRMIKSYIKIAYDLERYGRYAWDISFTHKKLAKLEKCKHSRRLVEEMTEKVTEMVHKSVEALRTHDSELAKKLAETEKEVDRLYIKYLDQLTEDVSLTKSIISTLLIVRYLERIADHATYIGESITYIVTGEKIILR
jgi:phosphate transport system protein